LSAAEAARLVTKLRGPRARFTGRFQAKLRYSVNGPQVSLQALGALATLAWSGVLTFVIIKALDATIGLRVTPAVEEEGLDTALHNERGIPISFEPPNIVDANTPVRMAPTNPPMP
jgi:ammonia channel protein AmtB